MQCNSILIYCNFTTVYCLLHMSCCKSVLSYITGYFSCLNATSSDIKQSCNIN